MSIGAARFTRDGQALQQKNAGSIPINEIESNAELDPWQITASSTAGIL